MARGEQKRQCGEFSKEGLGQPSHTPRSSLPPTGQRGNLNFPHAQVGVWKESWRVLGWSRGWRGVKRADPIAVPEGIMHRGKSLWSEPSGCLVSRRPHPGPKQSSRLALLKEGTSDTSDGCPGKRIRGAQASSPAPSHVWWYTNSSA